MATIHQMFDLTGRVALVTGASGYLGAAISQALAEAGALVVCGSRDPSRAAAAANSLPSVGGGQHVGVVLDQLNPASIETGFQSAVSRCGRVDILVDNAHEGLAEDWTTVTYEQFVQQQANAAGYFHLARLLRNHAVQRQSPASVILVGSMYGLVGSYPDAYEGISTASTVAYHALKGGIIHMTRHLAVYWAKDQVRVNCLSPGPFPNVHKVNPQLIERLNTKTPMGRMGKPDELKGAIVFLASDASSYVTGHNLVVDGGWTSW